MNAPWVRLTLLLTLVGPGFASAAPIVLDAFSDPFPPNSCLANSGAPVVFSGTLCDGVSCPPDPFVDASAFGSACREHAATGLAGVFHGSRYSVTGSEGSSFASLQVIPGQSRLAVAFGAGNDPRTVELWYDGGYSFPPFGWNLDLSGLLAVSFELEGNVSPACPAHVVVSLDDLSALPEQRSRWIELDLTAPGTVTLPIGAFTTDPNFDATSVDMILVRFEEFGNVPCDLSGPGDHRFQIGPITLVHDTGTAVRPGSWGRLKTRYR